MAEGCRGNGMAIQDTFDVNRDCPLAQSAGATQPSLPMISNGYH